MFNNKNILKMKQEISQPIENQLIKINGFGEFELEVNEKSIKNLDKLKMSFGYLIRILSNYHMNRSLPSEKRNLSKLYSLELLERIKNHDVVKNDDSEEGSKFKKGLNVVISYHNEQEEKRQQEIKKQNLEKVLSPVLKLAEEKTLSRLLPFRNRMIRLFEEFQKNYDPSKQSILNNERSKVLKMVVNKEFNVDIDERTLKNDPKKSIKETALQYYMKLHRSFKLGVENVIKDHEQQILQANTAKLLSNLVKYVPFNVNKVQDIVLTSGAKGYEIEADLFENDKFVSTIYTNAHAAGGWNIQSFHFRYKTKLK